ncbi:hypothetical protein COOONC_18501 [Cooperia oncophora]
MRSVQRLCCLLLFTVTVTLSICDDDGEPLKIAVIGEGVIGLSTATAIKQRGSREREVLDPNNNPSGIRVERAHITVFHDRPFEKTLSRGIAGLFRVDKSTPLQRLYGNETFTRLAKLWRTLGGFSGVQLLSGHILSDNMSLLNDQYSHKLSASSESLQVTSFITSLLDDRE